MRVGGFLSNFEAARMGEAAGAIAVPHNWASNIGLLMGLHIAKAVKNIPAAEDDRSSYDVLLSGGYSFTRGHYSVPDAPGLGLAVNEKVYDAKYRQKEIAVT